MKKVLNSITPQQEPDSDITDNFREYPFYPDKEDIYNKFRKEKNIDPEGIPKVNKTGTYDKAGTNIEKTFISNVSGDELDIPGSELDDEQENVGSEDEENNYYSIGGDDHNDLDEDKEEDSLA